MLTFGSRRVFFGRNGGQKRDCSEHAQGMFLVLADARIGPPCGPPKIGLSPILSNKGPSTSLRSAIKKGPARGPILMADRESAKYNSEGVQPLPRRTHKYLIL